MDRACHFLRCFNRLSVAYRRSRVIDLYNDPLFDMNVKEKSRYRDVLHNFYQFLSCCHYFGIYLLSVFNYSHINRIRLFRIIPFEPEQIFRIQLHLLHFVFCFLLSLYRLYFINLFYFNHKKIKNKRLF